jgi:hypothetical protein
MIRWQWLVAGLLAFGTYNWWSSQHIEQPPGILVSDAPVQKTIHGRSDFRYGDYTVTPLASFSLEARVLARKDYRFGREADLSPMDLALGWQAMSDSRVLSAIDISQSNRFYFWRTQDMPVPRREIERNSANMHLIPANDSVADAMGQVREGSLVALEGYLVRVDASDGWHWVSSLTRDDTGNGACEVIWVESFKVF